MGMKSRLDGAHFVDDPNTRPGRHDVEVQSPRNSVLNGQSKHLALLRNVWGHEQDRQHYQASQYRNTNV